MKNFRKMMKVFAVLMLALFAVSFVSDFKVKAAEANAAEAEAEEENSDSGDATKGKAIGAGIAIGLAALSGALAMGLAIAKSNESVARQPEAESSIRSSLMLGLVFIETVVIYALIVAILIIFVM